METTANTARDWISGTAFLVQPETPMDFAVAIQAMPQGRAQAVSRAWFTRDRQQHVGCTGCVEGYDYGEMRTVEWPCETYKAIREASDG